MTAAKYNTDTGLEGEHAPDSKGQVLKNLLGISTVEAMDEVEIETLIDVQDKYLCLQAGLPQPDYGFTSSGAKQRKKDYLAAVVQGYECNYAPLATFFREALERATKE